MDVNIPAGAVKDNVDKEQTQEAVTPNLKFETTIKRLNERAGRSKIKRDKFIRYLAWISTLAVAALLAVTIGLEDALRTALIPSQAKYAQIRVDSAALSLDKATKAMPKATSVLKDFKTYYDKETEKLGKLKIEATNQVDLLNDKLSVVGYFADYPLRKPYDIETILTAESSPIQGKQYEVDLGDYFTRAIEASYYHKTNYQRVEGLKKELDGLETINKNAVEAEIIARKNLETASEALVKVGSFEESTQQSITRGAAIAGAIGIAIFLMQIFLSSMRYYARLAEFYEAQADALTASAGNTELALVLVDKLSPASIEFGKTPEHIYGKLIDALANSGRRN